MQVFVVSKNGQALMPCHPARARQLLRKGRAVVHRVAPMVIRLKDRSEGQVQPVEIKIDPGSRVSGLAIVRLEPTGGAVVLGLMEIVHRGRQISEALTARRNMRRRRRSANLRYRAPRFLNRGNTKKGWLAPSLRHRVDTTEAWVRRIQRWAPVASIGVELKRFDTQAMQNPEIKGVEYQQGALFGYEVREYLLQKWGRQCAYCAAENVPLQIEHIHPKALGGTNRVSNLTLSCGACNQKKAALPVEIFLKKRPDTLRRILAQAKAPLKDAAAINSTRWALYQSIQATGLPASAHTSARTNFNRQRLGVPKSAALDAACVGEFTDLRGWDQETLQIRCTGRGAYQRTRLDKFGFPRGHLMCHKSVKGFTTGDLVKASVPSGAKAGKYRGRVAIRASGSFNIQTPSGAVQGISHRHCTLIQRGDGYGYFLKPKVAT